MKENVFRRIRKYVSKRKQQETLSAFQEEMFGYPVFFLLMVLSGCIATIGLLRESQSILIGAMLITPLVNPLMGVPLGIVAKSWTIFRASLIRVLGGVLLFWGIAYLVSDLLIVFSPEIIDHQLWNTSKFLVELPEILMAIFAGIVAAISVASEKVHSLMAGAAIAIAMAPPLAASAVSLAIGKFEVFEQALNLFLINAGGMILMGLLIFLLFGFRKKETEEVLS